MATYLEDEKEIYDLYTQAEEESQIWRRDYHEYERLADNDLIDDLDETLPEVNDGTLAAALFKLPKRIVSSNLKGRVKATNRDDAWLTELANMTWENKIIPNANSQPTFHRKWKDAVRKAAIYGSVPIVTLFVERGDYIGADFIVAQPQDVLLESGKVSDNDSDVMYWDIYFSKLQVKKLIERAKVENKENTADGYNKWYIKNLEEALESSDQESRDADKDHNQTQSNGAKKKGIHFLVAVQRGVESPYCMYHKNTKKKVREWSNPDPTGDVSIHFLYCYQDFINPYGTGIVKLAGGTQNVLDHMRQVDVLATDLGFRPPVSIGGDVDSADLDSIVYAQDAQWYIGNATVERQEISNTIYQSLPDRINMYKSSLNNLLPMGDTSVGAGAGDPLQSKTPAGVKLQEANLSIDDEDFKDNFYQTYAAVAKSMINTHFANMQGTDLMKLSDEERDILMKAGLEFPVDEEGNPTNELEIIWDEARATFDYEIDPEQDKARDDEKRLEGLLKVAELRQADPMFDQRLMASGKKINDGELYGDIIHLTSDNDKILEDISPEDMQAQEEQMMQEQAMAEQGGLEQPIEGEVVDPAIQDPALMQGAEVPPQVPVEDDMDTIQAVMEQYAVDEPTAMGMLEAERQGYSPEEVLDALERKLLREQEEVYA